MDRQYYKDYYHLERNHWWFTARLQILQAQIEKIASKKKQPISILNIGIATGATSIMLEKYGDVTSLEYDAECCEFVREKCNIEVIHGSMTELPFDDDSFDLVCAFDVVEHIEDHAAAIEDMKRVMNQEGNFLLTVPAFMFLWSEHDEINHHFRRYTKRNFKSLLVDQKLKLDYISYFNSILFPPIAAVRTIQNLFSKKKELHEQKSDFEGFNASSLSNKVFKQIFLLEKPLVTARFPLPFGISIIAAGRKNT